MPQQQLEYGSAGQPVQTRRSVERAVREQIGRSSPDQQRPQTRVDRPRRKRGAK